MQQLLESEPGGLDPGLRRGDEENDKMVRGCAQEFGRSGILATRGRERRGACPPRDKR